MCATSLGCIGCIRDGMFIVMLSHQEPLAVPIDVNEDQKTSLSSYDVECGGASTTASGGWHLGVLKGFSVDVKASDWLTSYFAQFPRFKVRLENLGSIVSVPEAIAALCRTSSVCDFCWCAHASLYV